MDDNRRFEDIDVNQIMIKPLYFGLFANVLIPAGLLFICYYLNQSSYVANKVGGSANALYYVLGGLSIAQAVFAIWWQKSRLSQPMIRRKETFERDLAAGLMHHLRPVFLVIAGIAAYGLLYFYLTGRFESALFLILMSFIAFQVVRPRVGSMRKIIRKQLEHIDKGRFLTPGGP